MWLKNPFTRHPPEQIQALTDAILELSTLLRVDLQSRGVSVRRRVPIKVERKLTAKDVTVLTRSDVLDRQIQETIEAELATRRPEAS